MNYIITAAGQIKTGTDTTDFFQLQTGDNVKVYGLGGDDTVYIQSSLAGADGDLNEESYVSLAGGADSIFVESYVESSTILGGAGGDTIRVSGLVEYGSLVAGGDGSDLLDLGGVYSATVRAGNGADTLTTEGYIEYAEVQMGAGADLVEVGDYLYSASVTLGGGADTLTVSGYVDYSVIDAGAGADSISINGSFYSSRIQGGGNSDTIVFESGYIEYSVVNGGAGGDLIVAKSAYYSSKFFGDSGSDTISIEGANAEYIKVYGGDGADSIFMSAGVYDYDNTVQGGMGADTIEFTRFGAQNSFYGQASESNISAYDKVIIGESAGLVFDNISVTGVYSYGDTNTVVSTNSDGVAQFNTAVTDLEGRVSLLDDVLSRGEGVLFDAVVDGNIQRFVFVQGGPNSDSGIQDDYLIQVNNLQGRSIDYFNANGTNNVYLSASA